MLDKNITPQEFKKVYVTEIVESLLQYRTRTTKHYSKDNFIFLIKKEYTKLTKIMPREMPVNDDDFIESFQSLYNDLDVYINNGDVNIFLNQEHLNEMLNLQRYCALNIDKLAGLLKLSDDEKEAYSEFDVRVLEIEGGFKLNSKAECIYTPDYMYNDRYSVKHTVTNEYLDRSSSSLRLHQDTGYAKVEKAYILQLTHTLFMLIPDTVFINRIGDVHPKQMSTSLSYYGSYNGENGFHKVNEKLSNGLVFVKPCYGGFSDVIEQIGTSNKDLINKVLFKQHRTSITNGDGGEGMGVNCIHNLYCKEEVDRLFPDLEIVPAKYNGEFLDPTNIDVLPDSTLRWLERQNRNIIGLYELGTKSDMDEWDFLHFFNDLNIENLDTVDFGKLYLNILNYIENVTKECPYVILSKGYEEHLKQKELEKQKEDETAEIKEEIEGEIKEISYYASDEYQQFRRCKMITENVVFGIGINNNK